jgi:predicted transcriptional regulator YdeE
MKDGLRNLILLLAGLLAILQADVSMGQKPNEAKRNSKSSMEPQLITAAELKVIGIQIRTTNGAEASPATAKIPGLWGRFFQERIADKIPNRKTPGVIIATYSDYETDFTGPYSLTVGAEVTDVGNVPEGMKAIRSPAGKYMVFSAQGPMPQTLIDTWKHIWQYFPNQSYKRAYTTDYEIHSAPDRADIYIAVK